MTIIRQSLRSGWHAAAAQPRLAVAVWFIGLVPGLSAAIPAWRWLATALGESAESARALERFSLGLFVELVQYDRFSPLLTMGGETYALVLLGILVNPLVAAGVLEAIAVDDGRPLLHRFMRGAGHFYGRFLRLVLVSGVAVGVLVIGVTLLAAPVISALGESAYERGWAAAHVARLVLLCLAAAFAMAAADIARARVVLSETELRGMTRAWAGAARVVLRRPATVAGSYFVLGLLLAAALGLYLAITHVIPTSSWAGIVAVFVVQQAFMLARAGLRVMRAGVALHLARAWAPAPAAVVPAVPPAASVETFLP